MYSAAPTDPPTRARRAPRVSSPARGGQAPHGGNRPPLRRRRARCRLAKDASPTFKECARRDAETRPPLSGKRRQRHAAFFPCAPVARLSLPRACRCGAPAARWLFRARGVQPRANVPSPLPRRSVVGVRLAGVGAPSLRVVASGVGTITALPTTARRRITCALRSLAPPLGTGRAAKRRTRAGGVRRYWRKRRRPVLGRSRPFSSVARRPRGRADGEPTRRPRGLKVPFIGLRAQI